MLLLPDSYARNKIKKVAKNSNKNLVVAFGDSFVSGVGNYYVSPPEFLSYMLGQQVINAGVSGDATQDLLDRIYADVVALNPGYCVVRVGPMDVYNSVPFATIEENFERIINILTQNGIEPIICSPTVNGLDTSVIKQNKLALLRYYERFCRENGYVFVDMWSPFCNSSGSYVSAYFHSDNQHLNSVGNKIAAEAIYDKLDFLVTDIPGYIYGEEQGLSNNLFLTDTDEDGLADNWSIEEYDADATPSLIAHPSKGNWQQIIKSADDGEVLLYQTVNSSHWEIGKYVEFSCDIDTDVVPEDESYFVSVFAKNAGGSVMSEVQVPAADNNMNIQVENMRLFGSMLVPAETTIVRFKLDIYGVGGATVRIGNVIARKRV